MACDYAKVGTDKIFHYNIASEPANGKLEPHGHLARAWPAFEETAMNQVDYFSDLYGKHYRTVLDADSCDHVIGKKSMRRR